MKNRSAKSCAVLGLIVAPAFISGMILSASFVSAEDSVVDEITAIIPVSCTMSGSGTSSHSANVSSGTYTQDIGTTTIDIVCNDSAGFSIYAAGFTGNVVGSANSNRLVGTSASGYDIIDTGTATGPGYEDESNWAMKLETDYYATYPITIVDDYDYYSEVPNEYTKVTTRLTGTDAGTDATGASLTTTYAAYISRSQPADTYAGQVKYILLHPNDATPEPCPDNEPCIRITSMPAKTEYEEGDTIDPSGLEITLYNPDGSPQRTIPMNELTITPSAATYQSIVYSNGNGVKAKKIPFYEQTLTTPDGKTKTFVASGEGWEASKTDPYGNHGSCYFGVNNNISGDYYFTKYNGIIYALRDGETAGAIVIIYSSWNSYSKDWSWTKASATGSTTNTFRTTVVHDPDSGANYGTVYFDTIPESTANPAGIGLDSLTQKGMPVTASYYDQATGKTYVVTYNVTVR